MRTKRMTIEEGKALGMKYQNERKLNEAARRTENILLNQMSRYYAEVA